MCIKENKYSSTVSLTWNRRTMMAFLMLSCILTTGVIGVGSVDERAPRKLFGGYRITPKFCRASKTLPKSDPRSEGPTICMFNHECAQRQGEVVGACMDGFLFGACCQIPGSIDNSLLQQNTLTKVPSNLAAALSYETYGSQQASNELNYQKVPTEIHSTKTPQSTPAENNYDSNHYYENVNEVDSDLSHEHAVYVSNENTLVEDHKTNNFYVENESVIISSPASVQHHSVEENLVTPEYYPWQISSSTTKYTTSDYQPQYEHYSSELPTYIAPSQYGGFENQPSVIQYDHADISSPPVLNHPAVSDIFGDDEFTHSDITHPSADSVLVEDLEFSGGYGPSTVYVTAPTNIAPTASSVFSTAKPTTIKSPPKKPMFKPKPKPTPAPFNPSEDKYVLVQTIYNKKPQKKPEMSHNEFESIESIILMLNDTKHGPSYTTKGETSSTQSSPVIYSSSVGTQRPVLSTNFYGTTHRPFPLIGVSTHSPTVTSQSSSQFYQGSTYFPVSTSSPSSFPARFPESRPTIPTNFGISTQRPVSSTDIPITGWPSTSKKPLIRPEQQSGILNNNELLLPPSRRPPTRIPVRTNSPSLNLSPFSSGKPPSTSYVTGPTTPRPHTTPSIGNSGSTHVLNEKIDENLIHHGPTTPPPIFLSSSGPEIILHSTTADPQFVRIPSTQRPSPTVVITPKPTVNPSSTSTKPQQRPVTQFPTSLSTYPTSPSYDEYNPISTQQTDFQNKRPIYFNPPVISNDFDDPGYFSANTVVTDHPPSYATENLYTAGPGDDRPSYPGYYGPTPTYPPFQNIPTASDFTENAEEETHTSPNDYANFPPVRHPNPNLNLNTSATSSLVTNDLEFTTPVFIEDDVLKNKMHTLVSKIVESLQGNFEALAEMVEYGNASDVKIQTDTVVTTAVTTIRPTSTHKPSSQATRPSKPPQRIPSTRPSTTVTKPPTTTISRPITTRRPSTATPTKKPSRKTTPRPSTTKTKKPASPATTATARPTTIATKRPATKPTRKVQTTTVQDEIIDNEDSAGEHESGAETETDDGAGGSDDNEARFRCGVRPHVKSGRIVGGKGATFGEWPWQVLVRESTWLGLFTKNKCGGVLITNKFVMTAAHCQPGFLANLVAVFGEFDISGDLETKRSVTKNVKRVIVHRQYDAATFENDLALLELESPVHYDTHIVPICMPPDVADFTGRMATVTGWGRLKYGGGVPSVLQEVHVPIIENSVCQEMFHTAGHNKKILPSFLCAGYANGQKDSCEGDSGGPLVMQRDDGRWELAGTVSHGIKCAAPYLPGVYMRTTFYKPWLKSITGVK